VLCKSSVGFFLSDPNSCEARQIRHNFKNILHRQTFLAKLLIICSTMNHYH